MNEENTPAGSAYASFVEAHVLEKLIDRDARRR